MANTLRKKLARKVVLLCAVIAALAYLRMPGPAQALTCQQECYQAYLGCDAACHYIPRCELGCSAGYEDCLAGCKD
jgi:hypothetical protein